MQVACLLPCALTRNGGLFYLLELPGHKNDWVGGLAALKVVLLSVVQHILLLKSRLFKQLLAPIVHSCRRSLLIRDLR